MCPGQFCLKTLLQLIKLEEKLEFGVNTYRPEHVHLKCLIKRIYEILPNYAKSEVVKNFSPRSNRSPWKIIGLENISEREIPIFYEIALNNIGKMRSEDLNVNNLKVLVSGISIVSN